MLWNSVNFMIEEQADNRYTVGMYLIEDAEGQHLSVDVSRARENDCLMDCNGWKIFC